MLIFVAIGAIAWLDMARIVRGQTLSLRSKEFIEAAHVCGVSKWNIITRHIVPNVLGIVAVYSTLLIPSMILTESFLLPWSWCSRADDKLGRAVTRGR